MFTPSGSLMELVIRGSLMYLLILAGFRVFRRDAGSLSVSDLAEVLTQVEDFGGSVIREASTEHFAMIRDPDGQLIELLPDTWLANLPPKP